MAEIDVTYRLASNGVIILTCWRCPHSMRSSVCVVSVRLSVPSIDSRYGARRVCCWAPVSVADIDRYLRVRAAGASAQEQMRPASCREPTEEVQHWHSLFCLFAAKSQERHVCSRPGGKLDCDPSFSVNADMSVDGYYRRSVCATWCLQQCRHGQYDLLRDIFRRIHSAANTDDLLLFTYRLRIAFQGNDYTSRVKKTRH